MAALPRKTIPARPFSSNDPNSLGESSVRLSGHGAGLQEEGSIESAAGAADRRDQRHRDPFEKRTDIGLWRSAFLASTA